MNELAPGEPERLVAFDGIADGVDRTHPAAVELQRDAVELHRPTGLELGHGCINRERNGCAIVEHHAEDLILDAETLVDVADREDRPVVVTAAQRVERVLASDPPVGGHDRRLGMGGFPLAPGSRDHGGLGQHDAALSQRS